MFNLISSFALRLFKRKANTALPMFQYRTLFFAHLVLILFGTLLIFRLNKQFQELLNFEGEIKLDFLLSLSLEISFHKFD